MLEHHDDVFAEFPDHKEKIAKLMHDDHHFAILVKDYAMLDRTVFGLEERGTPVDDHVIEDLKKQRLHLKDQIFASL